MNELWKAMGEIRKELGQLRTLTRLIYKKGSWTPTYTGSATAGVTTYTVQTGFYAQIGCVAIVAGTLIWTAATGTGNVRINLPLTPANVANLNYGGGLYSNGVTWANTGINWFIAPNVALLRLFSPASNAGSTEIAIEAAGEIRFTAVYFV